MAKAIGRRRRRTTATTQDRSRKRLLLVVGGTLLVTVNLWLWSGSAPKAVDIAPGASVTPLKTLTGICPTCGHEAPLEAFAQTPERAQHRVCPSCGAKHAAVRLLDVRHR